MTEVSIVNTIVFAVPYLVHLSSPCSLAIPSCPSLLHLCGWPHNS